jgi:hypothetical protein
VHVILCHLSCVHTAEDVEMTFESEKDVAPQKEVVWGSVVEVLLLCRGIVCVLFVYLGWTSLEGDHREYGGCP